MTIFCKAGMYLYAAFLSVDAIRNILSKVTLNFGFIGYLTCYTVKNCHEKGLCDNHFLEFSKVFLLISSKTFGQR